MISGQQIPKPKESTKGEVVDPYIKMKVVGPAIDEHKANEYMTKHVENNGFWWVIKNQDSFSKISKKN